MATQKLSAEFLGKLIVDTAQPEKALPGINDLINRLKAELKAATAEAAKLGSTLGNAKNDSTQYAELKAQIKGVKTALSELNTVKKAVKLVEPGDVEGMKNLNREINSAVRTIDGLGRRADIKSGVFGLNPTSVKEGVNSLKDLKKAAQETRAELALMGDEKGLKKLDTTVKQNTARLTKQVSVLERKAMQEDQDKFENLQRGKQQKALETAHAQALRMNATFDKAREAATLKSQASQALFENLEMGKKEERLRRAHTQALAMNATFDKTEEARVIAHDRKIAAWKASEYEKNERAKNLAQRPLDPAVEEKAIKDSAQRRLGLVGGVGGASLLGVQASLMANYALLQGAIGSIQAGIKTSIELEAAFRNIQAVTVTTNKEMAGLETQIKSVASASKFSSVEVAQAALILGQAGLNAKQTGDALKAVATLAVASGTSMAESVDLVTSVIGVFDKKASEAMDVANKITAAANSSKINVEKMILGFQYAGNAASQMGVSFEEATAAMAAMSNAGIKSGSTMGTGLRAFLTETQKPTEEFIKIITNLGLSLTDLDFKSHGLLGVARNLREAGFIASDAIKSFDVRSAAAFNAMVANPEDLERQYRLLLDTNAGLAAEEIQMDSLQSQSQRLTTSLGNLAASGFEPLGKMLKNIASGMATVAQGMSEWSVAMGIVGTTLGVALAAGVAKYTLSLALGAAATLGLTTATAASVSSMTVGAAVTSLLTRAKLAYASAAGAATASTFTLAGAVRLLSGVTIFGALGLAITAVTAVFVGFSYAMDSSKRKTDELRAALDSSKGAYDEQMGVISSLNSKIEELNHKSDSLAGTQKDVELMGVALTAQFGKEGFASDKLANSFSKQAEQLVKLRDLKEQAAKQSLELARLDAGAMVQNQTGELSAAMAKAKQQGTVSQGIDRALNTDDIKLLNAAQVTILQDMKKALEKGDPQNPGPLASATEILKILSLKLKDKDFFNGRSNFYGEASSQLQEVNRRAGTLREGQGELTSLDFKKAQAEANKKFAEEKIFAGKTFVEAIRDARSVGIEQRIIASGTAAGPNGKTDPLQLHTLAMAETRKSMEKLAEVERILEERRINTTDEAQLSSIRVSQTEVRGRREAAKVAMDRLTEQTDPAAERAEKARKAAAGGSERQKNKDVSAEEIRKNALAEAQFKFRGVINPDWQQEQIDAAMKGGEQRAVNKGNSGNTTAVRQFRLAEELALREAKVAQQDANLAGTEDAAKAFLDVGLKARAKARDAAFQQLKSKLKEDYETMGDRAGLSKGERDLELQNFNEVEDNKDREFVQGFTGFAKVAQVKLHQIRAQTNETRQDLLDLQSANTQSNYDRGEKARELQQRYDTNTSFGDPRGENLILVRTLKKELVSVDQQYLVSKEAELKLEALIIEGAEQELAILEASLKATEAKVEALQKLHDMGKGFMTGTQQREFIAAKGQLDPERTEVRNQRALVAAARRQRVDTQQQLYSTRGRIRENLMPDIKRVDLENLGNAMDDVWAKWQNISANMDIVRTMREGFGDQINVFTNNLSTMFMNISTGTQKVSTSFKEMALNTIQSMAQIINQMLAMWAVQQMIGMAQAVIGALGSASGGMSGASVGTAPGSIFGGGGFNPSGITMPMPFGAEGGRMTSAGLFERVQHLAGGGPVMGGTAGRDSVPTMLMPGEFVVRKSAADVVGADFLHGLNAQTEGVTRKASSRPEVKSGENKVLNIWFVGPEAAKDEGMAPSDVIMVVADNIDRGGSLKKLIKQINLGTL